MSSNHLKMTTIATLFFSALVLLSIGAAASSITSLSSDFAGGSGTVDDPYIIMTPAQLNNVRFHLDSHFKLGADIDLFHYSDGEGWEPIASRKIIRNELG